MTRVKVAEGVLEGEKLNNEYGGSYYSFKGIPYAEPPLKELRFKAPKPKQPWSGVRLAKEHAPSCYQIDIFFHTSNMKPTGSEDCLYLNVYTPDIAPREPYPVMVYIHGGGFICGNGNSEVYGPNFLIKNDVILVTVNYRLEVLGFLCLDTEDIPGNAGLKDQVAALRWVKNNIKSFGGDPNNVTIFGESAGAACVSYHLVSPMSKGLFHRAITQSGTLLCHWTHSSIGPRETGIALAKSMGCESTDDKDICEFFKNQPIENLIMKSFPLTFAQEAKQIVNIKFNVVAEKEFPGVEAFFTGDVYQVLHTYGIHEGVDVINGVTVEEGSVVFASGLKVDTVCKQAREFDEFLIPQPLSMHCSTLQQLEIGKKMKGFYLKDAKGQDEIIQKILRFLGMDYFKYCASLWQKICAKNKKNKIYFYKFTCHSERNIFTNHFTADQYPPGATVSHCDDLVYLFPFKFLFPKVDPSSRTYQMIENVTKLWSNFAKYGNPTPDNNLKAIWKPYTIEEQYYMDIGETLKLETELDKEEIDFWENIFREYYPRLLP